MRIPLVIMSRCCQVSMLFAARVVVDDGAFDLFDQVGNGDTARAGIGTVEDRAAAPDAIALSQDAKPLCRSLIATIEDEAVSVDDRGRTHPVGIAPYRWAGTRTGAAEDAFCALVKALALSRALQAFRPRLVIVIDQVGLDSFILLKERIHIDNEVLDDREAKHGLDSHFVA